MSIRLPVNILTKRIFGLPLPVPSGRMRHSRPKPLGFVIPCFATFNAHRQPHLPWANNQNGLRAGKLFLLWATLYSTHVNTGSFIASHLEEHAKSSKVAITVGGLITTLAQALGFSDRIGILWLLYTLGHIYLLVPF